MARMVACDIMRSIQFSFPGVHGLRNSLRKWLLISYLAIVALFTGGVVLTLFIIGGVGDRTKLLVDRHWHDSNLIAQVHSLLSDVALFLNLSPEDPATATAQRELQRKIDELIAQIASSTFRENFRSQQIAQLTQLKVSLAGPIEVLTRLERQNQAADNALKPLIEEANRRGRRDLTVAALAFLCRVEPGYPVQFVSESLIQFGYEPARLLGQRMTILELIHPDDRSRVETMINRNVENRESQEFFLECRLKTSHGEVRWGDCRMLVQRDERGAATHLQGVLLDITEKIRLREQAAQASRLASLGELAAGVAHEINNPKATILLNAAVLKEISEGMLRYLDQLWQERGELALGRMPYERLRVEIPRLQTEVLEAAGRIRRIVEDLKEFAGAEPPEFRQAVDLNAVVQTAVRLTGNALK